MNSLALRYLEKFTGTQVCLLIGISQKGSRNSDFPASLPEELFLVVWKLKSGIFQRILGNSVYRVGRINTLKSTGNLLKIPMSQLILVRLGLLGWSQVPFLDNVAMHLSLLNSGSKLLRCRDHSIKMDALIKLAKLLVRHWSITEQFQNIWASDLIYRASV